MPMKNLRETDTVALHLTSPDETSQSALCFPIAALAGARHDGGLTAEPPQGAQSHDNWGLAPVNDGVHLPLVLRLLLALQSLRGSGLAYGGGPLGFEVVDVRWPLAGPGAYGLAELDGVNFVPSTSSIIMP